MNALTVNDINEAMYYIIFSAYYNKQLTPLEYMRLVHKAETLARLLIKLVVGKSDEGMWTWH